MTYLGIDPGWNGGLAAIGDGAAMVFPCPDDAFGIGELCDHYSQRSGKWRTSGKCVALIERAHAFPKQGVSSCFTFGRNYGAWEASLAAECIAYDRVSPTVWQRALGCLSHGDKKITLRRARELFPGVAGITHRTADALLIAEYLRRKREPIEAASP